MSARGRTACAYGRSRAATRSATPESCADHGSVAPPQWVADTAAPRDRHTAGNRLGGTRVQVASRLALPPSTLPMTAHVTDWIARHGIYAVFLLMAVDALLPVGGELVMLFAGALAGGAIASQHVTLFGAGIPQGAEAYVVLVAAGTLGYLAGSLVGWAIGAYGGRALIERHGRWLHLGPARF